MRVTIAAVASAVALFFFGFLWWGVIMPIAQPAQVLESEELVYEMDKALSEPGVYFNPSYINKPEGYEGSTALLYYLPGSPDMPKQMGIGFAHMLICSVLAAVFVSTLNSRTYLARFGVVFFLGIFAALWADIGNMIWWFHPMGWTSFHFYYDVITWAIAGFIIAAIVQPVAIEKEKGGK